jgi:hypothetical protein
MIITLIDHPPQGLHLVPMDATSTGHKLDSHPKIHHDERKEAPRS